ncbi:DUF3566 domain-containing protein [Nocardioides sp. CPCC 205120]|uniref:DUF3566 domain-containing protein n=1 Tax=Nocardioides sp. CPCC 205120 TaxID=3406462 RepID=UPI003B50AF36
MANDATSTRTTTAPRPPQKRPPGQGAGSTSPTQLRKRRVRRAQLRLTRIDPWSVMKTAFLLSIAFAVVTVVSVFIVWSVLGAAGVWDSINSTIADVLGSEGSGDFDVQNYVGMSRVLGLTMLISAVNVILITAMATLGAFLYNLAAALLGGIEVTLAEESDR